MSDLVKHSGTVVKIEAQSIYVKIEAHSACSGCHAKGACSEADKADKVIECTFKEGVEIGDRVSISITKTLGLKAVLLGYFLPFMTLVVSLIAAIVSGIEEAPAALLAISVTIVYYIILYVFRDKIKAEFTFKID